MEKILHSMEELKDLKDEKSIIQKMIRNKQEYKKLLEDHENMKKLTVLSDLCFVLTSDVPNSLSGSGSGRILPFYLISGSGRILI